jgi:hypothetical protein
MGRLDIKILALTALVLTGLVSGSSALLAEDNEEADAKETECLRMQTGYDHIAFAVGEKDAEGSDSATAMTSRTEPAGAARRNRPWASGVVAGGP